MKKLIVVTIIAVLLCIAALYAAYTFRTEHRALLSEMEANRTSLEVAQREQKTASDKLGEATKLLDSTKANLERTQKDLEFAEAKLRSLQERSRKHTAVCDFKLIAQNLAKTKGIGAGNLGRYGAQDILNLLAHRSPEPADKADSAAIAYGGSCYLPPGKVTSINDIPVDKADEVKQALKAGGVLTIVIENPLEEAALVEAPPPAEAAPAPAPPAPVAPPEPAPAP